MRVFVLALLAATAPLAAAAAETRPLAVVLVLDTSTGAARVFRGAAFEAVWSFVATP